ncbi:MAG: hypothetical protein IID44_14955 [Planctomycetes bacterium]|nr:hypothetical protein [Planctomycetota bacterium]
MPISGDPTVYSSLAKVTVNFTEKVLGVDASDMVLTGSGASGASVGTPSALRVNDGIWTFIISGLSIGTVDVTVAPDVNDITYDDGGASVDTIEWTFIAMPGVSFTSGALVIEGTSGADTITVAAAGGDLTLNGAKVNLGSGDIAASAVTSILIQGYAGDDTIDLSAVTSTDFTGAGLNGNITIYGGSGSDTLTGSSFDDVIDGDQGTYIARWELNEIDASGYTPDWVGGYDGEIIDDPQVTAGGPSGDGYLTFDGGDDLTIDRVVVGNVDAMKIRDRDFSMSAWVLIDLDSDTTRFIGQGNPQNGNGSGWDMLYYDPTSSGRIRVRFRDGDAGGYKLSLNYYYSGDFADDAWHHVAFTFDFDYSGSNHRAVLYVDGQERDTLLLSNTDFTDLVGTRDFAFGAYDPLSNNNALHGSMDDVRIYHSVLTAADITNQYDDVDGADTMYGGPGDDTLSGGGDNDTIYGQAGNDTIRGNTDNDILDGGAGNDTIYGGQGNDTLYGYAGADTLYGDTGNDTMYGGDGNETMYGGDGDDTIYGGDGDDLIFGEDGDDSIFGDAGADSLYGGLGADTIRGGTEDDAIFGEDGDDILWGDAGNDTISGGLGCDTIDGNSEC